MELKELQDLVNNGLVTDVTLFNLSEEELSKLTKDDLVQYDIFTQPQAWNTMATEESEVKDEESVEEPTEKDEEPVVEESDEE